MTNSPETSATHYENLESVTRRGADSNIVFRGMTRSGSPSLHAILEESRSEDDSVLSEGESSGSPVPRACNTVMSATPIMTKPPLEVTPTF
jgi:hypothetical protein